MPLDQIKAREQWLRYVYSRDNGHMDYVRKAARCEDFVCGDQWSAADKAALRSSKRPAITVNKVLITLSSIVGEQIETRSEISFRPRNGAASTESAEVQTKLFRFISDDNHLNWLRTDVFADGAVTSRGYYDVRLKFDNNVAGDVEITRLNPRNVLPDPDASAYDPDTWNDVIVSTWMTGDDIELLYGKADADILRQRADSSWAFGYDSMDIGHDRFGSSYAYQSNVTEEIRPLLRNIRVIERQHRVLTRQKMFVNPVTGQKRIIPETWSPAQIAQMITETRDATGVELLVTSELAKRIRWTVTADDVVLHDDWSPYRHFTVVPYFPVFRYGRTVGLVEGLLDPQELLNKTISQELHVVNTMANSGWIIRSGAVLNMTLEELEEMGAKSGLVLEVNGDVDKSAVKIQPNQIPTGLDRISFKAENFIKSISGRGDSVMGLDRADVSGKAIGEKKQSADVPLRPALDNLDRTDHILARNIIDIVQQYYTDPRILNITQDDLTGEMTSVSVNEPQPGSGEVMNDLSVGTYDIVVVSQSAKRTLEESQFEQGIAMRELGIMLPDRFLIENSNLVKKAEIVKQMDAQAQSEEALAKAKSELLQVQLAAAQAKADVSETEAKAALNRAKTMETAAKAQTEGAGVDAKMVLEQQRHEQEMQMMREKHELEMQIKLEEARLQARVKMEEARAKAQQAKIQTAMQAKQLGATPGTVDEAAKLARAGGGPAAGKPAPGQAAQPAQQAA